MANRKVGILLDPAMSRRWQASAAKRAAHDDRFLHLDFTIHGRQFAAHAVYLPLRNHPVDQHTAFEAAEAYYEKCAQHTARVGRGLEQSSGPRVPQSPCGPIPHAPGVFTTCPEVPRLFRAHRTQSCRHVCPRSSSCNVAPSSIPEFVRVRCLCLEYSGSSLQPPASS